MCLPALYILIWIFWGPLPWTPNVCIQLPILPLYWMSDKHLKFMSKPTLLLQCSISQFLRHKIFMILDFCLFYIQIQSISKFCWLYLPNISKIWQLPPIPWELHYHHLLLGLININLALFFILFFIFKDYIQNLIYNIL